jgi:hypothetical protein
LEDDSRIIGSTSSHDNAQRKRIHLFFVILLYGWINLSPQADFQSHLMDNTESQENKHVLKVKENEISMVNSTNHVEKELYFSGS